MILKSNLSRYTLNYVFFPRFSYTTSAVLLIWKSLSYDEYIKHRWKVKELRWSSFFFSKVAQFMSSWRYTAYGWSPVLPYLIHRFGSTIIPNRKCFFMFYIHSMLTTLETGNWWTIHMQIKHSFSWYLAQKCVIFIRIIETRPFTWFWIKNQQQRKHNKKTYS